MIITVSGTAEEIIHIGKILELGQRAFYGGDHDYIELLKVDQKISAIKLHRARNGSTLKDAKEYIDKLQESAPRVTY